MYSLKIDLFLGNFVIGALWPLCLHGVWLEKISWLASTLIALNPKICCCRQFLVSWIHISDINVGDALSFNQITSLYLEYFLHFSEQNNVSYLLKPCLWPNTLTPLYYNKLIYLNCESLQYFSVILFCCCFLWFQYRRKRMIRKLF